jgi:hypothetical protein
MAVHRSSASPLGSVFPPEVKHLSESHTPVAMVISSLALMLSSMLSVLRLSHACVVQGMLARIVVEILLFCAAITHLWQAVLALLSLVLLLWWEAKCHGQVTKA